MQKKAKKPILAKKPKKAKLHNGSADYVTAADTGFDLASPKDWQVTGYIGQDGVYHMEFKELKPTKKKGKWMRFSIAKSYISYLNKEGNKA